MFGETDYYAWEEARRNIVIYSDRRKIFDGSVCHVEFRHATAELCHRRGTHYAADLCNLLDQLDHDPRQIEWLKRDVRLSAIHWDGAGLDPQAFVGLPVQDVLDSVRIPRHAQVHLPFSTLL